MYYKILTYLTAQASKVSLFNECSITTSSSVSDWLLSVSGSTVSPFLHLFKGSVIICICKRIVTIYKMHLSFILYSVLYSTVHNILYVLASLFTFYIINKDIFWIVLLISGTCREARQRQGHSSVYGPAFFEPASLPAHLSQPLLRLTPDNRLTFSTLESNTSAPLVRAVHKKKEMVTKLWYPCYILTNYWTFGSYTVNKFLNIILLTMFFFN